LVKLAFLQKHTNMHNLSKNWDIPAPQSTTESSGQGLQLILYVRLRSLSSFGVKMAVMHIDVFCTQFANLFCNVRFAKTNLFAIFLKIIVGHKKYYLIVVTLFFSKSFLIL
jgi:hypothetical protein